MVVGTFALGVHMLLDSLLGDAEAPFFGKGVIHPRLPAGLALEGAGLLVKVHMCLGLWQVLQNTTAA
jgi:hypothetical protein